MLKKVTIMGILIIGMGSYFLFPKKEMDLVDLINLELGNSPSSAGGPVFDVLDGAKFTETMYPWIGFPVVILSEKQFFGKTINLDTPPDEIDIKTFLLKYKGEKRLIFNIPSWNITYDSEEDVLTDLHIKWYLLVIQWAREVLPDSDIGVFGIPYSPWVALKSRSDNMWRYQSVYRRIQPLIDASDTIYPLFQVVNYNKNDLSYLMGAQLYIAKTSGKPVYPILSHRGTVLNTNYNQLVPADLVKQQCDFVKNNADGMVWWTVDNENWDDDWYNAVSKNCFL